MFKNQSIIIDKNKTDHPNQDQAKNYDIKSIPIHTMEKDIQDIESPSAKKEAYLERPTNTTALPELTDKQKSSPFLNPSAKNPARPKSSPDYSQVNKEIQPKLSYAGEASMPHKLKNMLFIFLLIAVFIGTGTYYFITTRKTPAGDAVNSKGIMEENKKNTDKKEILPAISTEKPNYLIIDIATINPNSIKKILEKSAQDTIASGIKAPAEFIIVDKQNNPVKFSDFSVMAGIALSEKIMPLLEKDFSLFFFNDNNNIGFGLKLKTTDQASLKNQLSQEEPLLHKELAAILPYVETAPTTDPFQNNAYKNYTIRYQNLISAQKLSIDYTFKENNLLIATTKRTLESILDKTSAQ